MERIGSIVDEEVAVVVCFWKEENCSEEVDTGADCAQVPEPLEGELFTDPAVDDGSACRAGSKEEGVDGHLCSAFMKEEDYY